MMSTSNTHGAVAFVLILLGLFAAFEALTISAMVRIIHRSGYSGWWVLSGLVPIFGVVMFFVFAFKEAPAERELKQLRAWAGTQGYGQPGPWGYR